MRYIADSSGYLLEVSFGADIICGDHVCVTYTGTVPTGYDSLEDWYTHEAEKLYRWKIEDGNLALDTSAVPLFEYSIAAHVVRESRRNTPRGRRSWRYWSNGEEEMWIKEETESFDTTTFKYVNGFYYAGFVVEFGESFASPPTVVVDGGSRDILTFLRVCNVTESYVSIWVLALENVDTDTVIHYEVYAKGNAITVTTAVLGTNKLGLMKLGEGV